MIARLESTEADFDSKLSALLAVQEEDQQAVRDSVAAISVGMVDNKATLDLNYEQDFAAAVDMNVVMTGKGRFVEIQGTGEEATFDDDELNALLGLARKGIKQLTEVQQKALGRTWPH